MGFLSNKFMQDFHQNSLNISSLLMFVAAIRSPEQTSSWSNYIFRISLGFSIPHSLILVDPLGFFHPDAVTKFTCSTQRILMLLLHFSRSKESTAFSVLRRQVSKNLENGVPDTVRGMINVLSANVLRPKLGTLELVLACFREKGAIFAIQFVSDNSNKNLVFQ